jgi:hypothetical protein
MKAPSLYVFAGLLALAKVNGQIPVSLVYENTYCGGTPSSVVYFPNLQCRDYHIDQCFVDGGYSTAVTCGTGTYKGFTDALFRGTPYLFMETYTDGSNCGYLDAAIVYPLDGLCHAMPSTDFGVQVTLNNDNSATMIEATDGTCSELDYSTSSTIPSDVINSNECLVESMKVWSNVNTGSTTTGATTTVSTNTGQSSGTSAYVVAQTAAIFIAMVAQTVLLI